MRIYRTYSKFNFCVPSLFLQGGRIQIFVIIFRRLRFMESKVMRPVEFRMLWYTWKDIYCEEQLKKKKKKREVKKKFVIGTNEYVQRIFIRIQNLFMRAISNDPKASSFGIFSKKSRNKRNNTNFIIYESNNLTCNLILLYDYYALLPSRKV